MWLKATEKATNMSQHDFNIANQGFPSFRSDLNSALGALATMSSGPSAPSTTFPHQLWYDTTANQVKMRNTADNAWIVLFSLNQGAGTSSFIPPQGYYYGGKTLLTTGVGATYIPPTGARALRVTAIGAGGGGGAVDGQGSGTSGTAGAGGGGGAAIIFITSVAASYTYTVGAGGSAGVAAGLVNGGTGGTTSFGGTGVSLNAAGGTGGESTLATNNALNSSFSGAGGSATGGDQNFKGSDGVNSLSGNGSNRITGVSGCSIYGGSVSNTRLTNAGVNGSVPGAGGSGASVVDVATNLAGGTGANGLIEVEVYY